MLTKAGIDYGFNATNRDPVNGIRYGVISANSVAQAWYESSNADYGDPTCPCCGNVVMEFEEMKHHQFTSYRKHSCEDFACEGCEISLDAAEVYGDEPIGHSYEEEGYTVTTCLDNDLMIIKSPYYTFARFCSPCVPGAGNLDDHDENGVQTYCFGHDWFEDGKAPYPVFSVKDDKLVEQQL